MGIMAAQIPMTRVVRARVASVLNVSPRRTGARAWGCAQLPKAVNNADVVRLHGRRPIRDETRAPPSIRTFGVQRQGIRRQTFPPRHPRRAHTRRHSYAVALPKRRRRLNGYVGRQPPCFAAINHAVVERTPGRPKAVRSSLVVNAGVTASRVASSSPTKTLARKTTRLASNTPALRRKTTALASDW